MTPAKAPTAALGGLPAVRTAAVLLAVIGCSRRVDDVWTRMRPQVFPATGTVVYQGKPCADATIMFEAMTDDPQAAGKVAIGRTDTSGRFRMKTYKEYEGAVAGPHRVSVAKVEYVPNLPPNPDPAIDYPTVEKHLLPERYRAFETSGLTVTVEPGGKNWFSISLD